MRRSATVIDICAASCVVCKQVDGCVRVCICYCILWLLKLSWFSLLLGEYRSSRTWNSKKEQKLAVKFGNKVKREHHRLPDEPIATTNGGPGNTPV